ncbi:molybdopterin-synthase adenylyltransferase MoeB [Salinimicrobium soli]|uniref:molybdopterin-synthase adenylyltransferase MoeB n=1 Tax=Salinimicrobium soli TaxID=1254399 RepID=UPI003AAB67F3
MDRYNRHIILPEIGQNGQDKISGARVLVVGAGGLGCPVLQYLAAAGIGTIGIIDFDTVEISNLQRQVLFGSSSLGQNKAIAAKKRLADLNHSITVKAYPQKLDFQNALQLFEEYDIIVDASDNFETRYLINDACILTNKPLVFGAVYKFQGQVSVFNFKNGPSYRCAFPEDPEKNSSPNCSEVGVLGVLPGIIGTMQANEVLKIILGSGSVLSGKILWYNALSSESTTLTVSRKDSEIEKIRSYKNSFLQQESFANCNSEIPETSIKKLLGQENIQFIDVRELHEQPKVQAIDAIQIPLNELNQQIDKISEFSTKAVFCQSGIRSRRAVSMLQEHNFSNCYSIREGASEINRIIKGIHKQVENEE